MNRTDQKADQKNPSRRQRSKVDRAVLPQFAPHRPAERRARMSEIREEFRSWRSLAYSSSRSLCRSGGTARRISQDRNKQVRDAGRARVAERGELLAVHTTEQENTSPEHLPLIHRLE